MRVWNRVALALLALAIAVVGVVIAAEALMLLLGRPPIVVPRDAWYAALTGTSPRGGTVLIVSVALLVVGLLLLIAQLRPWRPARMATSQPGWRLRRRATQRSLATAVDKVPGVHSARAKLGRGWRVRVKAVGDATDRESVTEAATEELKRLDAADSSRLRVRLRRRRVV